MVLHVLLSDQFALVGVDEDSLTMANAIPGNAVCRVRVAERAIDRAGELGFPVWLGAHLRYDRKRCISRKVGTCKDEREQRMHDHRLRKVRLAGLVALKRPQSGQVNIPRHRIVRNKDYPRAFDGTRISCGCHGPNIVLDFPETSPHAQKRALLDLLVRELSRMTPPSPDEQKIFDVFKELCDKPHVLLADG